MKVKRREKVSPLTEVRIAPDLVAKRRSMEWFVGRLFVPESEAWLWVRRIANLVTFPMFFILLYLVFK